MHSPLYRNSAATTFSSNGASHHGNVADVARTVVTVHTRASQRRAFFFLKKKKEEIIKYPHIPETIQCIPRCNETVLPQPFHRTGAVTQQCG